MTCFLRRRSVAYRLLFQVCLSFFSAAGPLRCFLPSCFLLYGLIWTGAATGGIPWQRPSPTPVFSGSGDSFSLFSSISPALPFPSDNSVSPSEANVLGDAAASVAPASSSVSREAGERSQGAGPEFYSLSSIQSAHSTFADVATRSSHSFSKGENDREPPGRAAPSNARLPAGLAAAVSQEAGAQRRLPPSDSAKGMSSTWNDTQGPLPASVPSPLRGNNPFSSHLEGQHACGALFALPRGPGSDRFFSQNEAEKEKGRDVASDNLDILVRNISMPHRSVTVGSMQVHLPVDRLRGSRTDSESSGDAETEKHRNEEAAEKQTGEGSVFDAFAGHREPQIREDPTEASEETGREVAASEHASVKLDISHFSLPTKAVFFFRWGKPPTFVNYDLRLEVASPGTYYLPLVRPADGISPLRRSVECSSPSSPLASSPAALSPSSSSPYSRSASFPASSSSLSSTPSSLSLSSSSQPSPGAAPSSSLSSVSDVRPCACLRLAFRSRLAASSSAVSAASPSLSEAAFVSLASSFLPVGRLYYLVISCTVAELASYRQKLTPRGSGAVIAGTLSLSFHGDKFLRIFPRLTQDERENMDFSLDPGKNGNVYYFHLPSTLSSPASPVSEGAERAEQAPGLSPLEEAPLRARGDSARRHGDAADEAERLESVGKELSEAGKHAPDSVEKREFDKRHVKVPQAGFEERTNETTSGEAEGNLSSNRDAGNRVASAVEEAGKEGDQEQGKQLEKEVDSPFTRFFYFAPKTLLQEVLLEGGEVEGRLDVFRDQDSPLVSSPPSSLSRLGRTHPQLSRLRFPRKRVSPSYQLKAAPTFSFEWHQVLPLPPQVAASSSSFSNPFPSSSSSTSLFSDAASSPPFPIACVRVNFSGAAVSTFQRGNEETGLFTSLDTCSFFSEAVHGGGVRRREKEGDVLSEKEGRGNEQDAEALGDARKGNTPRRLSTQEMGAKKFSSVSAILSRLFDLRAVDILKQTQRSAKREGSGNAGEEKSAEGGRQTHEWTFTVPQERLPEAIQKAAHAATLSWRLAPLLVIHRETPSPARRGGVDPQGRDEAAANKAEREESGTRRQTQSASVEKERTPPQTEGLQKRELSGKSSGSRGGDKAAGKHGTPLAGVSTEGVQERGSEDAENVRRDERSKERETKRAVGGESRVLEDRRNEVRETSERDTFDRTLFLLSQKVTFDLPARGPWAFTFYLNTTMPLERVFFSSESVYLRDFGSPQTHAALAASSPASPRSSLLSPAASVEGEPSLETFSKVPFFIRRHSCRTRLHASQCRETSETAGAKEVRQRQSSASSQRSFLPGRGRTGERGESGSRAKDAGFVAETSPALDVFSPTFVRISSLFSGVISPIISLFSTNWRDETEAPQAPVSSQGQSTQSTSLSSPVSPLSSLSSQRECTSCPSARSSLLFLPLVSPPLPSPSFFPFLILSSLSSSRSSPPSSLPHSSTHSSPSRCPCSRSSGVCDTWCATPLLSFSRPLLPIFQPNLLQSLSLPLGPETAERPALAELSFSPSDVSGGVALLLKLDAGDIWRSPQFVCEEADWQQEEARSTAEREGSELVKKRAQKARQQEVGDTGMPGTQRVGDSRDAKGDTSFVRAEGGEPQQQRKEHEMSDVAWATASDRLLSAISQARTQTDSRGAPFASQETREPFERAAPPAGLVKRDLEAIERAGSRQHASGAATEVPETDVVISFFTVEFLLRREAAPFRRAWPDELEAAKEETRDQTFNTHWGSATDTVVAHRWRLPFACRSVVAGGAKRGSGELPGNHSGGGPPVGRVLGADEETDDVSRRRSFAAGRVRTDKREFADEVQERSSRIPDTNMSRVSEDASSSRVSSLASVPDSSLSGVLSASGEASSFSPGSPSRTFSFAKKVGAGVQFLYEATVAPSWNFRPGRHLASWRLLRRTVVVSASENLKREINRFLMMTATDQEANRDELQKYEARKESVSETTFSQHEAQDLRWGNNSPGVFLSAQILADEPCEQTCHRGHCWPLGFVDGFRLNYCRCTLGVGGAACDEELLPRWYVTFLTALLVFSNLAFLFVIRFSIRELIDSARPWETEATAGQGEETLSRARWKRAATWRAVVRLAVFGTAMLASSMYHLCFDGDRCFVLSPVDWQKLDFLFSFFSILVVLVALSRLPLSLEFFVVGVSFAVLSRATLATRRGSVTVSHFFVSLSLLLLLRVLGAFPRRWKERRRQRCLLSPAAWRCRRLLLTAMARAIEAERASRRQQGPTETGRGAVWGGAPREFEEDPVRGERRAGLVEPREARNERRRDLERTLETARTAEEQEGKDGMSSPPVRESVSLLQNCLLVCQDFFVVLGTQVVEGIADPLSLLVGISLAALGVSAFVFFETNENYAFTHSLWHVSIELSPFFCLRGLAPSRAAPVLAALQAPRTKRREVETGGEPGREEREQEWVHEATAEGREGKGNASGTGNEERRQASLQLISEPKVSGETLVNAGVDSRQAGFLQKRFQGLRRVQAAVSEFCGSRKHEDVSGISWTTLLARAVAEATERKWQLETGDAEKAAGGFAEEPGRTPGRRRGGGDMSEVGDGTRDAVHKRCLSSRLAERFSNEKGDREDSERGHLAGPLIEASANASCRSQLVGTDRRNPEPSELSPSRRGQSGEAHGRDEEASFAVNTFDDGPQADLPTSLSADHVDPVAFLLWRQLACHKQCESVGTKGRVVFQHPNDFRRTVASYERANSHLSSSHSEDVVGLRRPASESTTVSASPSSSASFSSPAAYSLPCSSPSSRHSSLPSSSSSPPSSSLSASSSSSPPSPSSSSYASSSLSSSSTSPGASSARPSGSSSLPVSVCRSSGASLGGECLWCAVAGRLSALDVAAIQGVMICLRAKKMVRKLSGNVCCS
ncbi:UNVERIFIED_CONTAM: hypothetical protein HHA_211640 [Hammondia hammondi]|eukprot:XP_008885295.1 hypothetical protein HHA_211640 [Hammondia hammondi]